MAVTSSIEPVLGSDMAITSPKEPVWGSVMVITTPIEFVGGLTWSVLHQRVIMGQDIAIFFTKRINLWSVTATSRDPHQRQTSLGFIYS